MAPTRRQTNDSQQLVPRRRTTTAENLSRIGGQSFNSNSAVRVARHRLSRRVSASNLELKKTEKINLKNVGKEIRNETKVLEKKFKYPVNPIYTCEGKVPHPAKLQSIHMFCEENGIPSTQKQEKDNKLVRAKVEHKFWIDGINKSVRGVPDH